MADETKKSKRSIWLQGSWTEMMIESLSRLHPELGQDELLAFVTEKFREHYRDHDCRIHNTYENTVTETTLGQVVDWSVRERPLIAESGVFFYPKDKKRNVNIEIIKEAMLDARTVHKNEMFAAMEAGDTFTAAVKNLQQGNDKKAANSGYGAEGQSSSFLFNINSAMSVTASGRGQLSTMILCFENLIEDNVKFWDMDQFFVFVHNVLSEAKGWRYDTFEVIRRMPTRTKWMDRFRSKFIHANFCDEVQLAAVYDSLTNEQRIRLFYKCNLRDFLRNPYPQDLYAEIAAVDDFYDKKGKPMKFVDPNDVPVNIADQVKYLSDVVREFVGYRYSHFRYEDRARYMRRKAVLLFDTDSSFIYCANIMRFIMAHVIPYRLFKHKGDSETHFYKVMNVFLNFVSACLSETLWNYLDHIHVSEEDRKHIRAKSEFLYRRIIVTFAKKSYIGLLQRQESTVFKEPRIDVKGLNFFKSTSTEKTSDFIYQDLLMDQLLQPKGGQLSLPRIYRTIAGFQQQITDEIRAGDIGYMKRSVKVKSGDAYNEPFRISAYKAVYTWNELNDDKDRIALPATVTLVKVKMKSKKDIAALAPWPKIYERMSRLFETNEEFGDHEITVKVPGKPERKRMVKGKGVSAIAVPVDYDEIPDWLIAIIDVETLVNDNISLLTQINKALGFTPVKTTHNGATQKYYANVIRI